VVEFAPKVIGIQKTQRNFQTRNSAAGVSKERDQSFAPADLVFVTLQHCHLHEHPGEAGPVNPKDFVHAAQTLAGQDRGVHQVAQDPCQRERRNLKIGQIGELHRGDNF
jgi:hypothetical protein